mgnify:CR=1 FL=1
MKTINKLTNAILYAGLTRREFPMCAKEIKKRNARVLMFALPIIFLAILVLFILSLFPGTGEEPNRLIYGIFLGIQGVWVIVYFAYFHKHYEHVLVLSYVFMITIYAFGIIEALFLGASSSSTVLCVFLVSIPILVIDVPIRVIILTLIVEAALLGLKQIAPAEDVNPFLLIESLFCVFISIAVTILTQRTKYSDIRNHLMLEVQRDTDLLTGARSRFAFTRDVDLMDDKEHSAGVIFADVNGLKATNDTKGHEAGDRLIRDAFFLMTKYFHEDGDSIYRIGGDEFVILSIGGSKISFDARFQAMTEDDDNREIISCGGVWLEKVQDPASAVKEAERLMYAEKGRFYTSHPEHDRRVN